MVVRAQIDGPVLPKDGRVPPYDGCVAQKEDGQLPGAERMLAD